MNLEERHEAKQNLEIQQGQSTDVNAILQQWQTLVESANVVSQRRDVINGLFVTLSIAIITAVAALWDCRALPLLVAGCVMCTSLRRKICKSSVNRKNMHGGAVNQLRLQRVSRRGSVRGGEGAVRLLGPQFFRRKAGREAS